MNRVREWKPGDVIDIDGERAFIQVMSNGDLYVEFADYKNLGGCDLKNVTTEKVRPLVVIDPENREQVERLAQIMQASGGWTVDDEAVGDMQAVLREFADPKPPKPEEPTGLGAVVEDVDGKRWMLLPGHVEWNRWACCDEPLNDRPYDDINAVKVLSDGIPA